MSGPCVHPAALLLAAMAAAACSAGTTGTSASLVSPAESAAGYAASAADTAPSAGPTAADSAAARLARHVGFRQAIGDATRLGIVTGYAEMRPGRLALMLGPGFDTASTVEYHLKRIYSAYGDYLNHTLAPVLELHQGSAVVGDFTWDGLAVTGKGTE